jgi:hypothetical protein
MASGAPNKVHWFVEVGGGFSGALLDSWALRWTMPETVLVDIALLRATSDSLPLHVPSSVASQPS